jgi:hypothetical protein
MVCNLRNIGHSLRPVRLQDMGQIASFVIAKARAYYLVHPDIRPLGDENVRLQEFVFKPGILAPMNCGCRDAVRRYASGNDAPWFELSGRRPNSILIKPLRLKSLRPFTRSCKAQAILSDPLTACFCSLEAGST